MLPIDDRTATETVFCLFIACGPDSFTNLAATTHTVTVAAFVTISAIGAERASVTVGLMIISIRRRSRKAR
jgi:uncharacterized membrane protein YdjX (TVP38/TMEM64 family)